MGSELGLGVAALVAALAALRAAPRLTLAAGFALLAAFQLGVVSPAALPLGDRADAARENLAAWATGRQEAAICNQSRLIALSAGDPAQIDRSRSRCPLH